MLCMSGGEARAALALLVAVAVAVAAAHAHAHAHRRTGDDMSPLPFKFMGRYGRSPERLITPRTNRWLMNSRYGKRSESFPMQEDPPTQEVPPVLRDPPDSRDGAPIPGEPSLHGPPCLEGSTGPLRQGGGERMSHMLSCVYTGVLALYRCTRTQLPDKISRRTDPDPSEEE